MTEIKYPNLFLDTLQLLKDGDNWCKDVYHDSRSSRDSDWMTIDVWCLTGAMAQIYAKAENTTLGSLISDTGELSVLVIRALRPYFDVLAHAIYEQYPEYGKIDHFADTHDYAIVFNDDSGTTFSDVTSILEKSHGRLQELV